MASILLSACVLTLFSAGCGTNDTDKPTALRKHKDSPGQQDKGNDARTVKNPRQDGNGLDKSNGVAMKGKPNAKVPQKQSAEEIALSATSFDLSSQWITKKIMDFDAERFSVIDNPLLVKDVAKKHNAMFSGYEKKKIIWDVSVLSIRDASRAFSINDYKPLKWTGVLVSIENFPGWWDLSRERRIELRTNAEDGRIPLVVVDLNFGAEECLYPSEIGGIRIGGDNFIHIKDDDLAKKVRRGSPITVTGEITSITTSKLPDSGVDRSYRAKVTVKVSNFEVR